MTTIDNNVLKLERKEIKELNHLKLYKYFLIFELKIISDI